MHDLFALVCRCCARFCRRLGAYDGGRFRREDLPWVEVSGRIHGDRLRRIGGW